MYIRSAQVGTFDAHFAHVGIWESHPGSHDQQKEPRWFNFLHAHTGLQPLILPVDRLLNFNLYHNPEACLSVCLSV